METKFWAQRKKTVIGPFPTREEALTAFRDANPFNKPLYLATAKANEIMTGYGEFGPHFDIRWHAARHLPESAVLA